jgi:hypothetical protein
MQTTLRVDLGDGEFTVTTNLWTLTLWERRFKRKASDFANGVGIEDLAFLAYEACKQNKVTVPPTLDDFIQRLQTLEPVEAETEVPTEPAPTAGD